MDNPLPSPAPAYGSTASLSGRLSSTCNRKAESVADNKLFYGDNLEVLRKHLSTESIDLVYLDPPFNSNRNYNVLFGKHNTVDAHSDTAQIQAFGDTWVWTPTTEEQYVEYASGGLPNRVADALAAFRTLLGENDAMAYLVNMAPRLVELHRVLRPTGSLYLHCDPTMSHYLKIILDAIFDARYFQNEISWKRFSGRTTRFGLVEAMTSSCFTVRVKRLRGTNSSGPSRTITSKRTTGLSKPGPVAVTDVTTSPQRSRVAM